MRVGIIDTGIDGTHPDIAPNFDAALSRNFTVDIPLDRRAVRGRSGPVVRRPGDVDEDGHGTHVAGTIGSPLNGHRHRRRRAEGHLVNIRAGQDSGYFFLRPDRRRADLRRRHRHRRGQHELLHRPVALQLRRATRPTRRPSSVSSARSSRPPSARSTTPAATASRWSRRSATRTPTSGNPTFDDTSPDYPPGTGTTATSTTPA